MKTFQATLACAIALITMITCSIGQEIPTSPLAINLQDLKFVADINGKFFLTDKIARNGPDSDKYCKDNRMKSAIVSTAAEFNALKQAFSTDFSGDFYTSAKTTIGITSFTWADGETNDIPAADFDNTVGRDTSSCLLYHSAVVPYFIPSNCNKSAFTLCQIPV